MAQTMTPSITDEQIDKVLATFRAALTKKRTEFGSEASQLAMGTDNLGMRLLAPFRELVEANSTIIVRKVFVPARSFPDALEATGRKQYVTNEVATAVLSETEGVEREVIFAKIPASWYNNGYITCKRFDEFMDSIEIEPDPHGVAAVNESDPDFADEHPHGTQWKDAGGNYCCAAFSRWDDERRVFVGRDDSGWNDGWWVAGRRKSAAI